MGYLLLTFTWSPSRWCLVESELWLARCGGVPLFWGHAQTRAPGVPRPGNVTLPHLFSQQPGRRTLNAEMELSVCEGASQRTSTTCVRKTQDLIHTKRWNYADKGLESETTPVKSVVHITFANTLEWLLFSPSRNLRLQQILILWVRKWSQSSIKHEVDGLSQGWVCLCGFLANLKTLYTEQWTWKNAAYACYVSICTQTHLHGTTLYHAYETLHMQPVSSSV